MVSNTRRRPERGYMSPFRSSQHLLGLMHEFGLTRSLTHLSQSQRRLLQQWRCWQGSCRVLQQRSASAWSKNVSLVPHRLVATRKLPQSKGLLLSTMKLFLRRQRSLLQVHRDIASCGGRSGKVRIPTLQSGRQEPSEAPSSDLSCSRSGCRGRNLQHWPSQCLQ